MPENRASFPLNVDTNSKDSTRISQGPRVILSNAVIASEAKRSPPPAALNPEP